MSDEIRVKVNSYGPGRPLGMVYTDPTSGKKVARSTGTRNRREAERQAAVWEDELRSGRYAARSRVTWQEFRERFASDKLAGMPESSRLAYNTALDHLERDKEPDRLASLTAEAMSDFQGRLRKAGMKETTLARHLRHIKAALRWAARVGLLGKAPTIEMPKAAKGQSLARSRAVTTEEYERMLTATVKVRPGDAPEWQRLLAAAWLGGLRLGELVAFSWDDGTPFSVDLSGKRPCFRILAEGQKSGRDEVLPMVPQFAELLLATPEAERTGLVFRLSDQRTHQPLAAHQIGRLVGRIGRKAGVVTNKAEGKFAGLHDLRRGFCTRWAKLVMPPVLRRLARHASIHTTLSYYVDIDAADLAEELWAKHPATPGNTAGAGNTLGNNGPEAAAELAGDSRPNFLS